MTKITSLPLPEGTKWVRVARDPYTKKECVEFRFGWKSVYKDVANQKIPTWKQWKMLNADEHIYAACRCAMHFFRLRKIALDRDGDSGETNDVMAATTKAEAWAMFLEELEKA